ncbi:J domain-containing protein [bacterium]|nr:J domain-containing protein [bacterium]
MFRGNLHLRCTRCPLAASVFLGASLVVFLFGNSLKADVREIYGLPFHVEEILPLENKSVRVRLFGELRIIAQQNSDRYIVESYLRAGDFFQRFDSEDVKEFLFSAAADKRFEIVAPVLEMLLREEAYPFAEKRSILLTLSRMPESGPTLKALLSERLERRLHEIGLLLSALVGRDDLDWLRTHESSRIFQAKDEFLRVVELLLQDELAGEKSTDSLEGYLKMLSEFFGGEDPEVAKLELLVEKTLKLVQLSPSEDRSQLYPYLKTTHNSPNGHILRPLVVRKIHDFADFAIQHHEPASALILLAELYPKERSQRTQELLIQAFSRLQPPQEEIRRNNAVRRLAMTESRNNPLVERSYISYLRRAFDEEVESRSIRTAALIREHLREVSAQSQGEYEQMIFEEALIWSGRDRPDVARQLLALRSHQPTPMEFFQLLVAGYFGSPLRMLLFALIPLLLLSLSVVRRREQKLKKKSAQEEDFSLHDTVEEESYASHEVDPVAFRNLRGGGNSLLLEYQKLLKEFDLSWQASLQEIKRVYRRKIKEVHPDSRERESRDLESDESSDAFILLSKKYDRILELREQLDLK